MEAYYNRLDYAQKSSFAPIDKLIQDSMDGLDLHVLVLRESEHANADDDAAIKGLVIFN